MSLENGAPERFVEGGARRLAKIRALGRDWRALQSRVAEVAALVNAYGRRR